MYNVVRLNNTLGFQQIYETQGKKSLVVQPDNSIYGVVCRVKEKQLMVDTALGVLLRALRELRGLTLREASQLAEMDHAYIHRLETGAKDSPSDDAVTRLLRALKPPKRESEMLRYFVDYGPVDPDLVHHVLADPSVTFEEFVAVAGMAFRSTVKRDYADMVERVRRLSD